MISEDSQNLAPWEILILRSVKRKRLSEKAIVRSTRLNETIVSEFITDLMFKGYIERRRYRKMIFFSKEYFSITVDGLTALEAQGTNNIEKILELLKVSSMKMAEEFVMSLPPIARDTMKATYKVAKFVLK